MLKKIIIVLLINLILICNIKALDLSSTNIVLYNLNDNTVVLDKNSKEITSIASLTKIMTVYVAILNTNDYNKKVTITYEMIKGLIEEDALVVGLKVGDIVTINDLLYATFLESGADAANALAFSISGSKEKFVELMNEQAKTLDLQLHFKNVIGLDEKDHYGSADSVAKLLMKALENDKFSEIFKTKEYESTNNMLYKSSAFKTAEKYDINIPYIIGAKTGYTDNAGKCLASIALDEKNNIKYLLVTIGADTTIENAYHILDSKKIYEYYFNNYKYYNVLNKDDLLTNINIKYSKETIPIKSDKEITIYHDNTFDTNKIKIDYQGIKEISPFTNNKELGIVNIYYEDQLLDKISINSNILDKNIIKKVEKQLGIQLLIVIIILMLILSIIHKIINKKKKS